MGRNARYELDPRSGVSIKLRVGRSEHADAAIACIEGRCNFLSPVSAQRAVNRLVDHAVRGVDHLQGCGVRACGRRAVERTSVEIETFDEVVVLPRSRPVGSLRGVPDDDRRASAHGRGMAPRLGCAGQVIRENQGAPGGRPCLTHNINSCRTAVCYVRATQPRRRRATLPSKSAVKAPCREPGRLSRRVDLLSMPPCAGATALRRDDEGPSLHGVGSRLGCAATVRTNELVGGADIISLDQVNNAACNVEMSRCSSASASPP